MAWTESANWSTDSDGLTAVADGTYPGAEDGDTAVFSATTVSGDVTVNGFSAAGAISLKNTSGNSVTVGQTSAGSESVTLEEGAVTLKGEFGAVTVASGAVFSASDDVSLSGDLKNNGTVTITDGDFLVGGVTENNGGLSVTGGTASFSGNCIGGSESSLTVAAGCTVTTADITGTKEFENSGTVTVTGAVTDITSLTNSEAGTLTVTGAVSAQDVFNGGTVKTAGLAVAGTIDSCGQNATSLLEFSDTGTLSVADMENSTLTNIKIGTGATLTLASDIIISGNVTNDGVLNANGNKLTLAGTSSDLSAIGGSGQFVVTTDDFTGEYLSIGDDVTICAVAGTVVSGAFGLMDAYCAPTGGTEDDEYITLFKNGWKLKELEFVWTGDASDDWNDKDNWNLMLVPGVLSNGTADAVVSIPDGKTRYPKTLSDEFELLKLIIGTQTSAMHTATLTVSDKKLIVTDTLTNYGTIVYSDEQRIVGSSDNAINDADNGGTVEYSGTAQTITNFTNASNESDYANLVISGSAVTSNNIAISGNFTVGEAGSFEATSGTFLFCGNGNQAITTNETGLNPSSVIFYDLEIASTATVTTENSFAVSRNFTSNAANGFTATGGTILFTGNTTVTGESTFWSLAITTAGSTIIFPANKTQTVSKNFIVKGSDGLPITLTTSATGDAFDSTTWWILDASSATVSVEHALVEYAVSVSDIVLSVTDSEEKEPLSTTNWFERTYYWLGTISSDWTDDRNWFYDEAGTHGEAAFPAYDGTEKTYRIVIATTGTDPILPADIFVKSLKVNAEKVLDFSVYSVTADDSDSATDDFVVGDSVTLRFAGQTATASESTISGSTEFGNDVIFEYYGGGLVSAVSGKNGADIPENQIVKIENAVDGTFTRLQLGSQNIAGADGSENKGIIEVNGEGDFSLADGLSMTSGLMLYSSAAGGEIPKLAFYNLQVSGGAWKAEGDVSCENFYCTGGTFSVESGCVFTVRNDFVAFGNAYDSADKDWHNSSNTRFAYPAGTNTFVMSDSPSASFSTLAGTVSVGNNFYVNGADMNADSDFTLMLPAKTAVPVINKTDGATATMWGTPYAVVFNMKATNCTAECSDSAQSVFVTAAAATENFVHQNVTDGGGNKQFQFEAVEIVEAYTVSDTVIYVELNIALENLLSGGTLSDVSDFSYNNFRNTFTGFFADDTCTDEIDFSTYEDASHSVTAFYLKASGSDSWNTDASGKTAGTSGSTDFSGNHRDLTLDFSAIEGFFYLKDGYTLGTDYYKYDGILDKTSPALLSLRTGQEKHTETSQTDYDAHNFIEFRYSEPVLLNSGAIVSGDMNVAVTDDFGALKNDMASAGPLQFAGIGEIASGKIHTGRNGSDDKYVNTIYRFDEYSFRIGIAALTDGTVSFNGTDYKNWAGYIEAAEQPRGAVTAYEENLIEDVNGNSWTKLKNDSVSVDSSASGIYGAWDISAPVFAKVRFSSTESSAFEAIGGGTGTSLNRIEIHFFDNTSEVAEWYTGIGWCSGSGALFDSFTYCADIFGGSRPFESASVSGALRYCTFYNQEGAFTYETSANVASPSRTITSIDAGADSSLFYGSTATRRFVPSTADNLYLKLNFPPTELSADTVFTISYDDSSSYITDLAGNRLRATRGNSIDRTPPAFYSCIAGHDKLLVTFSKKIISSNIQYNAAAVPESFSQLIPYCFEIGTIDASGNFTANSGNGLQIDTSVGAELVSGLCSEAYSALTLGLTRDITYSDLTGCYVRLKNAGTVGANTYEELSTDPFSGVDSYVTFIQDELGNYMQFHEAHAISDFAVDIISPQYAYEPFNNHEDVFYGLYEEGSYAVHDWSAEQNNYGTLPKGYEIDIVSSYDADVPGARLFLSQSPDAASVSTLYNSRFNQSLRVWLPSVTAGTHFSLFTLAGNTNFISLDNSDSMIFQIPKETTDVWQSGSQLSFLFGLLDESSELVTVVHTPYLNSDFKTYDMGAVKSPAFPLFALRLKNHSDITSLDLWSFKVKSVTDQRGGVTILNNVINVSKGEKTVLKVNVPSQEKLTVTVLTLDGNVVKYLNRGSTAAGEYYFTWDGTNKGGKAVARGMYFIRVTGDDFDETRKVMVVK